MFILQVMEFGEWLDVESYTEWSEAQADLDYLQERTLPFPSEGQSYRLIVS